MSRKLIANKRTQEIDLIMLCEDLTGEEIERANENGIYTKEDMLEYCMKNNITSGNFKRQVKNKLNISIHGIGYLGLGNAKTKINGKTTKEYREWIKMIKKCKDFNDKDTVIDDKFKNYNKFYEYYKKQE